MSMTLTALMAGAAVFLVVYAVVTPFRAIDVEPDGGIYNAAGLPADSAFERYVRPTIHNFMPQTPLSLQARARNSTATRELLIRSGNPWNVTAEEFLGLRVLSAIICSLALLVASLLGFLPIGPAPVWLLVGALLGWVLPKSRLDRVVGQRRRAAQRGLPEALDLMVISKAAGKNFTGALEDVVKRLPAGLIARELQQVLADINATYTVEEAMERLARRAPSKEVEAFCKAVQQGERTGASLEKTLTAQARAAREAHSALVTEKAGRLESTLFLPVMGLMFPALLIAIGGPAFSAIGEALG